MRATINATGNGFDPHSSQINILIFSFYRFGNIAKVSKVRRWIPPPNNAPGAKIGGNTRSDNGNVLLV